MLRYAPAKNGFLASLLIKWTQPKYPASKVEGEVIIDVSISKET